MVSHESQIANRQYRMRKGKELKPITLADQKRLADRRQLALQLRMAGASLQDIVNAGIGYKGTGHVSRDLRKALSGFYQEDIESLLILDLARIDEMTKYCVASLRQGNTGEVRNLMALMQFRRETMGVTPETIVDKRTNSTSLVNNGIMVVQGSTRDYLETMMEAAGASKEEMERELRALETASESPESPMNAHANADVRVLNPAQTQAHTPARVISGEVIEHETGTRSAGEKTGKKLKVRLKKPASTGTPGSNTPQEAATATHTASQPQSNTRAPQIDSILLGEPVEARVEHVAQRMDQEEEARTTPRLGSLDDPAIIDIDIEALEQRLSELKSFPVKLPDANQPVSPGVVYRNPPQKPTKEQAQKSVARKLKSPHTSTDTIRIRVHEEQI